MAVGTAGTLIVPTHTHIADLELAQLAVEQLAFRKATLATVLLVPPLD